MPPHLIIDGYNYLHRNIVSGPFDAADLEPARRYLLERLYEYKRSSKTRITVVFDATRGDALSRYRENHKGIEVVYSRRGETADEVILEAIRSRPEGLVVVTSDRAIIDEAKRQGVTFMTPPHLESALSADSEEEECARPDKKGNPRRLPKNVRKARRTIKKL